MKDNFVRDIIIWVFVAGFLVVIFRLFNIPFDNIISWIIFFAIFAIIVQRIHKDS